MSLNSSDIGRRLRYDTPSSWRVERMENTVELSFCVVARSSNEKILKISEVVVMSYQGLHPVSRGLLRLRNLMIAVLEL